MNPVSLTNLAQAPGTEAAYAFVEKFNDVILYPVIILLTGIAFLVFLYGCLIYITHAENSSAREEGRSHIIYSIIGMFVMLVAYAILQIAANTFGLGETLNCVSNPDATGCQDVIRIPNPSGPGSGDGPMPGGPGAGSGGNSGGPGTGSVVNPGGPGAGR